MRLVKPDKLKTDPDLAGLFPIGEQDLAAIVGSMRERGYDPAEPIVVWEGEGVIVDGHTRFAAAQRAGLEKIAIDERGFEDKRAALEYAIRRQRDRRNLTKAQMTAFTTRSIEALDRVLPRGGDHKSDESKGSREQIDPQDSAAETADQVGVSRATVVRARAVMASADEQAKSDLREGRTTVAAAYTAVKKGEQAKQESVAPVPVVVVPDPDGTRLDLRSAYSVADWEGLALEEQDFVRDAAPFTEPGLKATFNSVNEHIDWAKWSWNPVTGCLHNCPYCYARDIANHYFAQKFEPTFIPSRLHAPAHTKLPAKATSDVGWRNVFVCSMADLFGKWVPQGWIDAVFEQVWNSPQWNFLFLTKFPQRLAELEWPDNAWVGTSVDQQYRVDIAERSFRGVKAGVKWLSCEPLMERLTFTSLEMFDWVVIGAASASTQTPEFQPPWEWVEHLINQARQAGCRVYIKPNLKSRPQEYPTGALQAAKA